jgi:hypothetical protein
MKSFNLKTKIATVLIFILALSAAGCSPDDSDKLIKANHKIANAIDKTEKLTWELRQRAIVNTDTYLALNDVLTSINNTARDFHAKARTYESFDAKNKEDLLRFAEDSRDLIIAKINDGTLKISNPEARQQWSLVAGNILASFVAIVDIVRAIKPDAAPPAGK